MAEAASRDAAAKAAFKAVKKRREDLVSLAALSVVIASLIWFCWYFPLNGRMRFIDTGTTFLLPDLILVRSPEIVRFGMTKEIPTEEFDVVCQFNAGAPIRLVQKSYDSNAVIVEYTQTYIKGVFEECPTGTLVLVSESTYLYSLDHTESQLGFGTEAQ